MKTVFGLWDSETNNLVTDFDTESEALAYVADEIAMHGRDAVTTWALLRDEGNKTAMVAAGRNLAESRARCRSTPRRRAFPV